MTITERPETGVILRPENGSSLTVDHAVNIAFQSFHFSQGKPYFQYAIFDYIHSIRPEWTMTAEFAQEVSHQLSRRVQAYARYMVSPDEDPLQQKVLHSKPSRNVVTEASDRLYGMSHSLNSPVVADNEDIIANLVRYDIEEDHDYLITKGGRQRKKANPNTLAGDPWLSHITYYALQQHPTGLTEYNRMFADMRAWIVSGRLDTQESEAQLKEVIRVYNEKHPNNPIDPIYLSSVINR